MIALIGFTSATITFTSIPTLSKTGTSAIILLKSDKNESISFSGLSPITESGNVIQFAIPLNTTLTENVVQSIVVDYTVPSGFTFVLGKTYSTDLIVTGTQPPAIITQTLSFSASDYCILGEKGNWISLDVTDEELDNSDAWKWRPLNNIEITVNIDNRRGDDISGTIEYGLYDTKEEEFIFEDKTDFDVNDGNDEDYTLKFQINPSDLNSNTGDSDYIFYVKAYDDSDASEETQCAQFSENVKVSRNNDEISLDETKVKINPEKPSCGSEAEVVFELFNVGKKDQSDVSVRLYNKDFVININQIAGNIDVGESQDVRIPITIPENLVEKTHTFQIEVFDENGDIYQIEDNKGDKQDAVYLFPLTLEAGTCQTAPKASITAEIVSGGKAGEDLIVNSVITNTGNFKQTFTIQVADYSEWATLASIEPTAITLEKAESKEVKFILKANDNAQGDKTFNIQISSTTGTIKQPVAVTITKSGFNFGITGNIISGENWYLWAIGALNVILVIIIIVIAVRVAKS